MEVCFLVFEIRMYIPVTLQESVEYVSRRTCFSTCKWRYNTQSVCTGFGEGLSCAPSRLTCVNTVFVLSLCTVTIPVTADLNQPIPGASAR